MKAWQNVINTAMLGTEKLPLANDNFNEALINAISKVDLAEELDNEDKFLQKTAIIYNFRRCGFVPFKAPELQENYAEAEISPYCSPIAANILQNLIAEDLNILIEFWLQQCSAKNQIILPEHLPQILDKAAQQVILQQNAVLCCGNRGKWLSQFNTQWNYFNEMPAAAIWKDGNPTARLKVLKELRKTDPAQARTWLEETWAQETAAAKIDLLGALRVNLNNEDLPWLESLVGEKSQKLKDLVNSLLKEIPDSAIVKQYEALLVNMVSIKHEKAFLGLVNKSAITINVPAIIEENIFKTGIEKMSGPNSGFSDDEYLVYQLITFVPPSFWEKHFEANPEKVFEYFSKSAPKLISALAQAVARFKNKNWVACFLDQDSFYPDFIGLLSGQEQEKYIAKYLNSNDTAIQCAFKLDTEWSEKFAMPLLNYMADKPYQYNRAVYNQNIKLIPAGLIDWIQSIETKDITVKSTWEKTSDHIHKLLELKQQILKAFNA